MAQDTVFSQKIEQIFNPNADTIIMGILNNTPDSFLDGGKYRLEKDWLKQCHKMVKEGADIIDIGGFSTRPGSGIISIKEEEKRVIPVIKSVRKNFPTVLISVDTFRASVAQKAAKAGANIINDISGGQFDTKMFETVARLNVPYILMHSNKSLETLHEKKINTDDNIHQALITFFESRIKKLNKLGFSQIIIDPGIGFGKTIEQNYELVRHSELFNTFNQPIMIGVSRKSMITQVLNVKPKDALNATSVLHVFCLAEGAKILRVHNVKEAKQTALLVDLIARWG